MDENLLPSLTCPKCNASNPPEHLFCQACGTALQAIPPASPTAPVRQVSTYTPPVQPAQPTLYTAGSKLSYIGTLKINSLGQRLDGWADLVDGAGEKVLQVENAFIQGLTSRQMPNVYPARADLTSGMLGGSQRGSILVQGPGGSTVNVFIGKYGTDLYLNWDLFVRTVIQWRNVVIMLGIALVLGLIPELNRFSVSGWIINAIVAAIPVVLIALLLGKALYNNALYFFIQQIDQFVADDITAGMLAIHHALMNALEDAGIDRTLLRKKESFYAGRRERVI